MPAPRPPSNPDTIHALRAELAGVEPPIYRELLVRSSVTLEKLHQILQAAFGWDDSHLHQFFVGKRVISRVEELDDGGFGSEGGEDEAKVRVRDVLLRARSKLTYEYDFGDSWLVEVKTFAVRALAPGPRMPAAMLVEGARAAPPEDCGGLGGYEQICAAMADPAHPRRDELLEWLGDPFDPEEFDRRAIEARLSKIR